MRDAEAAADGEASVAAGQRVEEMVFLPIRRVGEAEARIDVVAGLVAEVDEVVAFLQALPEILKYDRYERRALSRRGRRSHR